MFDRYVTEVRPLLRVLPDIARETVFGLEGGTAINLCYRDMPRLSVDIDLTRLTAADRELSPEDIGASLGRRNCSAICVRVIECTNHFKRDYSRASWGRHRASHDDNIADDSGERPPRGESPVILELRCVFAL